MKNVYLASIALWSVMLISFQNPLKGQDAAVTGTVTDAEEGSGIPGVTVVVKGTTAGTITDADGNYRVVVNSPEAILVFSYIGFQTQEVSVGNQSELNIQLATDIAQLEEVVVIGYGQQSRTTLTNAVSKMDQAVLENIPFKNVTEALQGTVSGVRVQNTTGMPGATPFVVVRGGASINDPNGASPLYVIDGIIRDDLNGINPADIASMQVLKDAAATSIYGARGSNGVIIVTTKKGEYNKVTVTYDYNFQVSELQQKYDFGTARDYVQFGRLGALATSERSPERLGLLTGTSGFGTGNDLTNNTPFTTQYLTDANRDIFNNQLVNEGWESIPDPADPTQTIIFKNTDWMDVMFRSANTHNHYISAGGGSDNASFRAGLGYMDAEGLLSRPILNELPSI